MKFIPIPEHDSEGFIGVLWRGWDQPLSLFTWHHASSLFSVPYSGNCSRGRRFRTL